MHIKKINIQNFRQLKNIEVDFDKIINIIAGSNNTGKTSLLELFNIAFNDSKFCIDDFNNKARCALENDINEYKKGIINFDELEKKIDENKIELRIVIEYDVTDNISLVGEYITDLMSYDKLIYLSIECSIDASKINEINKFENLPLVTRFTYADSTFDVKEDVEKRRFQEKFNYKNIKAKRDVNDTSQDSENLLSKNLHLLVKNDEKWIENISKIKNEIELIGSNNSDENFETIFDELKDTFLGALFDDINNTTGGNVNELKAIMNLEEKEILKLLNNSIFLKYDYNGVQLSENSQGLGYSNLLYMLMEIYKYEQSFDEKKINLLFIEEPESHMHPSMERRLIKYLKNEKNELVQKIITSHSREIVGFVELESIKVLKKLENNTLVCDLNKYCAENPIDSKFIKKFINVISDIFYSDKAILFEGDSERIFLDYTISTKEQYQTLKNSYIAYVQVGGRHAKSYKSFLEFLKMKTLIFSDIDYGNKEDLKSITTIKGLKTTNQTLKTFIAEDVEEISNKVLEEGYGVNEDIVCLTQTELDGYARSFEDSVLYKIYKESLNVDTVLTSIDKDMWKQFNNEQKTFSITDANNDTNLLNRSMSLKGSKTDFVYDYILSDYDDVPDYIERGLQWLMNE